MCISNFSKNFINLNPALFQSTRSISNELLKILAREQPLPPPSQKRSGRNRAGGCMSTVQQWKRIFCLLVSKTKAKIFGEYIN